MPDRPLVSVITPTWQRHDLLLETVRHLGEQDYPNLELVVVSEGPDRELRHQLWAAGNRPVDLFTDGGRMSLSLYELGRNFSGMWPESFGVAPLTVGMFMARGDLQLWWSDDDRALTTEHVSKLVAHLERTGAGFVYPKVRIWRNGEPDGPETSVIGTDPPRHGQITHFLYRVELLRYGPPSFGSHPCDIALVNHWLSRGVACSMLDEVTYTHRLDQ